MSDALLNSPVFVGNDLALDFINTVYAPAGEAVDVLVDDASVMEWLAAAGVANAQSIQPPAGIGTLAIALRREAAELLRAAQEGVSFDAPIVNSILEKGRPTLQIESSSEGARLVERLRGHTPESLLEPVARAIGRLLAGGDLANVKRCQGDDCTLLFHDTTKSRTRRWCSMAMCGNRMKVAAFRSRKQRT